MGLGNCQFFTDGNDDHLGEKLSAGVLDSKLVNCYHRRKWTRLFELKSKTRLFTFHISWRKGINPTILSSVMDI